MPQGTIEAIRGLNTANQRRGRLDERRREDAHAWKEEQIGIWESFR